jgi:site-specific recombinase XerC
MESGEWTADRQKRPLSASTIAGRQTDVIQAMLWEVDRGERAFEPGFAEIDVLIEEPGARRRMVKRTVYDVVRRADPAIITFPTVAEVEEHIRSIQDPAFQIAAKLIYRAGLRGSEPGRLLISDLPGARRAGKDGMLSVIGKGNKRRKTELEGDIEADIQEFLRFAWPVRMGRLPRPEDPLLVNEAGSPISYRGLWEQFRRCRQSPHIGRHFYAIQYLLRGWEAQQNIARRNGLLLANDQMPSMLSMDLLNLSRNLGHADMKTTQRYLIALAQYTRNTQIALQYQDVIDAR